MSWWYAKNGERRGPFAVEQLRVLLKNGGLNSSDLAWTPGMEEWQPVSSIADLEGSRSETAVIALAAGEGTSTPVARPRVGEEACPHCGASNSKQTAYCESCGKALPGPIPKTPRIIDADQLPSSAAASKLMGDELTKQTRSAANALLVVAIIQCIVGGIFVLILVNAPRRAATPPINIALLVATTLGVGVIFLGLYFWARRSPLPAAIVGLVIYATLIALNVISSIATLARSNGEVRGSGFGGIGIGWLDIVILAILCRGISAALKQRKINALPAV